MKIIKHDPSTAVASHTPIMVGAVAHQVLVGEVDAEHIRVTSVTFHDGARNRFHSHSCDQILVVTEGRGVITTSSETWHIEQGDVVVVPAGEVHSHGTLPEQTLTHLSIVTPHETTFDERAETLLVHPLGHAAD